MNMFKYIIILIACIIQCLHATAAERPNLVWIFVEDMNDWMGCYGDSTAPTPHIDRLALDGVRFTRGYMPAGVCSAIRSAIAVGAMQTSFGIHSHRSSRNRVPRKVIHLPDGVRTADQIMRTKIAILPTTANGKTCSISTDRYSTNG